MADETACPGPLRTTLIHGDCLEAMPTLPDQSVQLIFADLPYGVTNVAFDDQKTRQRTRSMPVDKRTSAVDLAQFWKASRQLGRRDMPVLLTATQPFAAMLIYSNPGMYKYEIIWDKVNPTRWLHAKHMPLARHETIQVFYQSRPTYNPQLTLRKKPTRHGVRRRHTNNYQEPNRHLCDPDAVYTHYQPTSIVTAQRQQNTLHPHEKPVALLEWLVKTYTDPGDTVLDPTMGSASTGVACLRTGRHFVGIEKDAGYFDVARKRVDAERAAMGLPPADCR